MHLAYKLHWLWFLSMVKACPPVGRGSQCLWSGWIFKMLVIFVDAFRHGNMRKDTVWWIFSILHWADFGSHLLDLALPLSLIPSVSHCLYLDEVPRLRADCPTGSEYVSDFIVNPWEMCIHWHLSQASLLTPDLRRGVFYSWPWPRWERADRLWAIWSAGDGWHFCLP